MWPETGMDHHAALTHQAPALLLAPTCLNGTRYAYILLFAAVLFNALLAAVNSSVAGLTSAHVILAELFVVGCSHLLALSRFDSIMIPWYSLLGFVAAFAITRSLLLGDVDVKYFRDIAIIPTFIVLGMTAQRSTLNRAILALQCVVVGVMLLEAADTALYVHIFDVKGYYINTRGLTEDNFWNGDSDLFVSATRSGDRFVSFFNLPRLSSIFLEPVSLGNYCIIITVYLCAMFSLLGLGARIFMIATNALLLVGCDGRLALVSSAIVVAGATLFGPRLSRYTAVFSLPALMAGAIALVFLAGLEPGSDNFSGRLAYTVYLAGEMNLADYLGLSNDLLAQSVDSGIVYLLLTQSVFGVIAIWVIVTHSTEDDTPTKSTFVLGIAFYLSFTMLISYSFLTIKTSSILWFVFGILIKESKYHKAVYNSLTHQR